MPDNGYDGYLNRYDVDQLLYKGYEIVIGLDEDDNPIDDAQLFYSLGYNVKGFYIKGNVSEESLKAIDSLENKVIIANIDNDENYNSLIIPHVGLCDGSAKKDLYIQLIILQS